MRNKISQAGLERAVSAAYAALQRRGGLTPRFIIEDLIGLNAYRWLRQCPDTETLAAYAEDALPLEAALSVAAHENRCPVCRADIVELRQVARQQLGRLFASLPAWTTPFVGRNEARERLGAALGGRGAPLVTVAACGGTGKTRLCLETAVECADLFPDGVWYVPLAGETDAVRAATEIARAAKLPITPREAPLAQLRDYFSGRRALLILDDVPARSPAGRLPADLLQSSSDLRCLAIASEALGTAGETFLKLPPLPTPGGAHSPERLPESESVQLFTEHVHTFAPDFPFAADMAAVGAICTRAAGMPLGIELAAARVREMPPEEIARDLAARRRQEASSGESLQDLISWSYGLLSEREQQFLERLSVFEGGFRAEQAAEVCEAEDAASLMETLERQGLLQSSERSGRKRGRLPSPVQAFASERLGDAAVPTLHRHMAYFMHYARIRGIQLAGHSQIAAREELSEDLPNLRAGMDRAQTLGDLRAIGGYGQALPRFFYLEGLWQEGTERLRASADAFGRLGEEESQRKTQLALARLLTQKGDYAEAEPLFRRVREEAAARGDAVGLAAAERGLGNIAQYRSRYAEATGYFERALRYFEETGDRGSAADCRANLGWLAESQGDNAHAEALYTQALEAQRERGDRYQIGTTLANLGNLAFEAGRMEEAHVRYAECLRMRQELGDSRGTASAIGNLGRVWQARGDSARAEYCFAEAARRFEQLGDRRDQGEVYALQGRLALDRGDTATARRHLEAGIEMLEAAGSVHTAALARGDLGEVARQEGREAEALRCYQDSLSRLCDLGDKAGMSLQAARIGILSAARGDTQRGLLLLYGAQRFRTDDVQTEAALADAEPRLDAARLAELRAQAVGMPPEEIVALALRPPDVEA